jgi:hypothetical protein
MGLIFGCLAGSASEKGQGGRVAAPPVRSTRKVGIMHESPRAVDIHADKNTDTSTKVQVFIYRCCPNCGKGDTPLSRRKWCEVCGTVLPAREEGCQKTR